MKRSLVALGPLLALLALLAAGCAEPAARAAWSSTPPDGMRWVGLGRVVVAVPDWWTTGETRCLAPVEDTVYFDQGAQADCTDAPTPAEVREVSALAVLDATHGYGELLTRDMHPIGEIDGRDILEREGCEEWFSGVCRRVFAVPEEGVVFAVTIAEEGDGSYEAMRDSLRILPDGLTTVPLASAAGWTPSWGAEPPAVDDLTEALTAEGLTVVVRQAAPPSPGPNVDAADLPQGSLLAVSPGLGSVIEEGGTVTILVAPA